MHHQNGKSLMREIDFNSGKSTTKWEIPHERAALMQLHGVVVPLFLVAYSNKPLFIVMGQNS